MKFHVLYGAHFVLFFCFALWIGVSAGRRKQEKKTCREIEYKISYDGDDKLCAKRKTREKLDERYIFFQGPFIGIREECCSGKALCGKMWEAPCDG